MCALVREAIAAGAAGFSTSFSYAHRGVDGKPVPSRFAEARRGRRAVPGRGRGGQGRGPHHARASSAPTPTSTSGSRASAGRSPTRCSRRRAASTSSRVAPARRRASRPARRCGRRSRPARSRCSSRWPTRTASTPARCSASCCRVTAPVRLAAYRDPAWRARAAADLEQSPMKPRWETFEVSESARFPELEGRRVTELAAERGCSPLDVMCELALAEDLATRFRAYIANDDVDAVGAPAHARAASRSASPTPARTSTSSATRRCPPTCSARGCASARSCRSRRRCASSPASRPTCSASSAAATCARATGPTCACSIRRRSGTGPTRRVRDFPADAERLTAEEPTGVRHVLVNGTPIRLDGAQVDDPDLRPGVQPELA